MKKQPAFSRIKGSITAPRGFRAAGISAGIKPSGRKDMALIVSDVPATAAAVFTTNKVKAAPVHVSQQHARGGAGRAIIANSGNANACTGDDGMFHALAMTEAVARRIGCPSQQVFVCSTGRIGVKLPIVKVQVGIKKLLGALQPRGSHSAAEAIMTSDTFPKEVAVAFHHGGRVFHVGGIAKGAGMIQPNMATMLSFVTTDVAISRAALQKALKIAVNQSFNRISVDGDMSTNDTVIALANGLAGKAPPAKFQEALNFVCLELAKMIVRDGEGVTKFVTVNVTGARNDRDAEIAARSVGNSVLVKTSWCGGDPNWGRIMDSLGYSRAHVVADKIDIAYDGLLAVRGGRPTKTPMLKLRAVVGNPDFTIDINLRLGSGRCTLYTCDLTEKYVELNKGE